ncbi:hypothetical protein GQ457_01G035970 [Hibiscus cannabinus]
MLSEQECKKLCKFIDCQKLSQEASNHAAQNERLPVQMAVRVLYFEQLRLKNALCGAVGMDYCGDEAWNDGQVGNGKTFFNSLSKGIGRIGIFSGPGEGKRQKSGRKSRGSEGKTAGVGGTRYPKTFACLYLIVGSRM